MLMGPVDRAVEAMPFVVGVAPQGSEESRPPPGHRPTIESVEHRLPRAELRRQIAPRDPSAQPPQHGLDEPAVVLPPPPGASLRL